MFLQLLNIERFITENKLMEVKSFRIPFKKYDEDGLWSEVIFGPVGSKSRGERFAYIDLKQKFIHPIVFDMITTVSDETSKITREKGRYIIKDGKYVEDASGETGIAFLIKTFNDIKFSSFCHTHKQDIAEYLDNSKPFILIDKFVVSPAAHRDIDIYNFKGGKLEKEIINELYTKLIIYIQQITSIEELDTITIRKIQGQLNDIVDYFKKKKMTGKKGLFRGTMLKKSMDYSTRLVLTNDSNIPLGYIGLPWHALIAVLEPFMIHHLFKKEENIEVLLAVQHYTGQEKLDYNGFSNFVKELIRNPDVIPNNLRIGLTNVLNQFLSDMVVVCKRDPVTQRKSWFSATPMITEGRVAYVNSVDLGPIGGDSDGDTVAVLPVFTDEAKEEVQQKMNPAVNKSKWKDVSSYSKIIYSPSLDAISAIYSATEK